MLPIVYVRILNRNYPVATVDLYNISGSGTLYDVVQTTYRCGILVILAA